MSNSYSPVLVNKPSSLSHTVRLSPTQEFSLRTDKEVKFLQVDPLIKLVDRRELSGGATELFFEQDPKIEEWAEKSSVYLGNVYCKTVDKTEARLCISVNCSDPYKKDLITVYNPKSQFVKIEASQILHVVISEGCFGPSDVWKWTFDNNETDLDVDLHQMGKREIDLGKPNLSDARDPKDIYFLKEKTQDFYHPSCREHQYWFRFDNRLLPMIRTKPNKVYYVGSMEFYGFDALQLGDGKPESLRSLDLWVNLKNKQATKFSRLMGVEDYGNSAVKANNSTFPIIHKPSSTTKKTTKSTYSGSTHSDKRTFKHYSSNTSSFYSNNYKDHRTIREVDIVQILPINEGEKCTTRTLIPSENEDYYDALVYKPGYSQYNHNSNFYAY